MSSMPHFTLVSKQSTYVHDNYHQSRFHFMKNFFNQSSFHFMEKMTQLLYNFFSSMELLFTQRTILMGPASTYGNNYFLQSSFYCIKNLVLSIQLLFPIKIISTNPTSI